MSGAGALARAIELFHFPAKVRLARTEPLPDDILLVLRIAARDDGAEQEALYLTERPPPVVREAAEFFIEQIMFAPGADAYRVLGATPDASAAELRRNMALLLRWLHPDADRSGERAVHVQQVTSAWEQVKTAERRAAYDVHRPRHIPGRAPGRATTRRRNRAPLAGQHALLAIETDGGGLLARAWRYLRGGGR